ncbi:MAG: hypothetical protein FD155_2797 [Bacteroidetes bacterium]|nr:MAG: hypothetical protein FD155_2797 [Bacteroidota bacterium]
MKTLLKLSFILLLIGFGNTGCEKIKSLADVTFDANYESTIDVDVVPSALKATNGTFFETVTIDPLSNSDMATYANLIKDIDVVEVSAEVISLSTPVQLISATLNASSTGFTDASWSFANETLTVGKVLTLSNDAGQFDNLQKILTSKNVFTVTLQGQTDVNEATFSLLMTFKTRVTANPL